jgi:hypothetical protein
MDYDHGLLLNEGKTMNVNENVFFREATLRTCSSLNIVEALEELF